jgi:hypothetical protein
MSTLKIQFKSEASYNQVRIDKTTVLEVHHPYDNTFDIELSEKKVYYLTYFIQGNEGNKYSFEIKSPIQIPKQEHKIKSSGQSFGYIEIDLSNI